MLLSYFRATYEDRQYSALAGIAFADYGLGDFCFEGKSADSKSVKALVLVFALAMATLGALNFAAQWNAKPVTDGVKWIFFRGVVVADSVTHDSAGSIAGIDKGDQLIAINFHKLEFRKMSARLPRVKRKQEGHFNTISFVVVNLLLHW